jgi:hypothetical protein
VGASLSCKEKHHQHGKKHHVAGKAEEDKEPDPMQEFARAASCMTPIVVATAATAACGAPVNWRFSAYSWLFPFRFRRGMRKGSGHARSSVKKSILSLLFGRIAKETVGSRQTIGNLSS